MQDRNSLDATCINTIRTLSMDAGLTNPTRERTADALGTSSSPPAAHDSEDIEEFPLLLRSEQVRALIEAARHQGLTAVGLARRLIGDYLRQSGAICRSR